MKSDRPNNHGKTFKSPRRPFDKERLDMELQMCGKFGLKNKRELWRVQLTLSKIRKAARLLLTLDQKDPRRIFEGQALLRRLTRLGLLQHEEQKLDYILQLQNEDLLKTRLQTNVHNIGLAKSIHHARVIVHHGHVTVNSRKVTVPSFKVFENSSKFIEFNTNSPMHQSGGKPGRVAKRSAKNNKGGDE